MPPFSLVVFDLDGTLIDSRRDIADAANALLVEHGAPPLPEERIGRMVGNGASVLVARAFDAVGRPQPSDALAGFLRHYDARLVASTRPYDGVMDLLEYAQTRATLAVLTNKPLKATRTILDALDLARYFRFVLGGDGPLARKPDPAGLAQLIAAAAATEVATLMVGDSIVDLDTAVAAGTRFCMARYGFGSETFPAERIRPQDFTADRPRDIARWL